MKKYLAQFSTRFVPLYQNDNKEFFIDKFGYEKINIVNNEKDIIENEDFMPSRLIDMSGIIKSCQNQLQTDYRQPQIMELPFGNKIYLMAEYLDDEDNYHIDGIQPVELSGIGKDQRIRIIGSPYTYNPSLFKVNQIIGVSNGRNMIHKAQRFLNVQNDLFLNAIIEDMNNGKGISKENIQSLIYINTGLYTDNNQIINDTKKELRIYLEEDFVSYLEEQPEKSRGQILSDVASIAVEKVLDKIKELEVSDNVCKLSI